MYVPDLIRIKRDGGELSEDQIRALVTGIADGSVSDAQVGALAMAVVLRGMTAAERIALTGAMRDSGDVLDWSDAGLPGPALDKHSTGGVGDKVSLLLAPIVAACGGAVPMISGRGLGHTGGTLDKLESIPGYDTTPEPDAFRRAVAGAGAAIVGQTARLAPADRRLYAIRDATGTVESIPLIVASILSKKLAAGLDALVMDVKVGSGAFLPDREQAEELARTIVEVATGNGLPDRRAPHRHGPRARPDRRQRGRGARVDRPPHRRGERRAPARGDARAQRRAAGARRRGARRRAPLARRPRRRSTAARRRSASPRWCASWAARRTSSRRPTGTCRRRRSRSPPSRRRPGRSRRWTCARSGLAVVALGGGRTREDDPVDHSVGLTDVAAPGEEVAPGGRPLAMVHAQGRGLRAARGGRPARGVRAGRRARRRPRPVLEVLR